MVNQGLLTAHELAKILGLSVETVWRYTREKRIPYLEVGTKQYRYRENDVLNALNNQASVQEEKATYLLTHEDYAKLPPETGYTIELIDGLLFREPSPTVHHQRVSRRLLQLLIRYFENVDPTGEVFSAPLDLYLDEYTVVQPDLLYLPSSRPAKQTPVDSLPELVVEILSPSSIQTDRIRKLNSYRKAGIPHYWIVDPLDCLMECYVLQDGYYLSIARFSEGEFNHPRFPDLHFDLEAIFTKPN